MTFVPMLIFLFSVIVFLGVFYVIITSIKRNPTQNNPKDVVTQVENKPLKKTEPKPEPSKQEEYEYCEYCGALISKKDKKCKECGAKFPKQLK